MNTAANKTVNKVPRTCLSLRIDVQTALHEAVIKDHFVTNKDTLYKSCLIYREIVPKVHFHIRITSTTTRQNIHKKLLALYKFMDLEKHQHSHHTVWETVKGKLIPCKKHKDCKMGSMTYIAKNCSLVASYGVDSDLIKSIELSGKTKMLKSKLPTYVKICLLGDLDQYSKVPKIIGAMKLYYDTTGLHPPLYPKHLLHKLMCHLKACGYVQNYYTQITEHLHQNTNWYD